MPTYHFCLTAEHEDPIPPVAELQTIEADDARSALELLAKRRIVGEPGADFAWLRVAFDYHDDGSVRRALSQQVPLVPVSRDN